MNPDPIAEAARDAYRRVRSGIAPDSEIVAAAVAAGVREALRLAGVEMPEHGVTET